MSWKPIDTAPTGRNILVAWADEDQEGILSPYDAGVLRLLVTLTNWKPGQKAWMNQGSANYGTPRGLQQWPTHWTENPVFNET